MLHNFTAADFSSQELRVVSGEFVEFEDTE